MSASWSIADGTVTLTLDGTGSGQVSRSHTFTGFEANELYTFYLTVNPSVAGIGAFLEVVGGDTTVATTAGAQTLRARGETNASGEITVRFGAQHIESSPSSEGTDALDYASEADAVAGGWTVSNTTGDVTITWAVAHPVGGFSPSINFHLGSGSTDGTASLSKTFTVVNGQVYVVHLAAEGAGSGFEVLQLLLASGAAIASDECNGGAGVTTLDAAITAQGTSLTVTIAKSGGFPVGHDDDYWFAGLSIDGLGGGGADADFSGLTYCRGSGLGTGGTGLGEDGDDPVPPEPPGGYPPPPSGGARPFTCANLPPEGFGFWNGTIEGLTVISAPNVFTSARTAGAKLFVAPVGLGGRVRDSAGRFSYDAWQAEIDAFHADARANAALEAAIADGTAFRHYVIDEPMLVQRWGLAIPFATVERMCLYSKSLWPTWGTCIRVDPTNTWMVRHMAGCDDLWASYLLPRGEVTAYRTSRIAAAQALGHGLVIGMNISDFAAVGGRAATPAEIAHYGGILAASCDTTAFAMWQYNATDYAQAGCPASVESVRDMYGSYDP